MEGNISTLNGLEEDSVMAADATLCLANLTLSDEGRDGIKSILLDKGIMVKSMRKFDDHSQVDLEDPAQADQAIQHLQNELSESDVVLFKPPPGMPVRKVLVLDTKADEDLSMVRGISLEEKDASIKLLQMGAKGTFNEWEDVTNQLRSDPPPQPSSSSRPAYNNNSGRGGLRKSQRIRGQHNGHGGFFRFLDNYYTSIPDLPTRMAVPIRFTGAIIGKKGETIRGISQSSKAQIHINLQPNWSSAEGETIVDITGSPMECGKAVKSILDIVESELYAKQQAGEPVATSFPLKLLANRTFIGRLVGKDGRNLRSIENKSKAKVSINNRSSRWSFLKIGDSVVTVIGNNDECAAATVLVMKKLSNCHRNDLISAWFQSPRLCPYNVSESHAIPVYSEGGYADRTANSAAATAGTATAEPSADLSQSNWHPYLSDFSKSQSHDSCYLSIPKKYVGSVIGWKGFYIKRITWLSGTSIEIINGKDEKVKSVLKMEGPFEGRLRAQYLVFERIKERASLNGKSFDLEFDCDISIPSETVPELIGEGGMYMKKLQSFTNCQITVLPNTDSEEPTASDKVKVSIIGKFFNVQSAQKEIFEFVQKVQNRPSVQKAEVENKEQKVMIPEVSCAEAE